MESPVPPASSCVVVLGETSQHFADQLAGLDDLHVKFLRHQQLTEALAFAPDLVLCVVNEALERSDFDPGQIVPTLRKPMILYGEGAFAPSFETAYAWGARDALSDHDSNERVLMSIRSAALLGQVPAAHRSGGHDKARARRICVYGAKGGVGTTTIATNLAAVYAREGLDTLLIDLDLQFGDVAMACDVRPSETLIDFVMRSGGALDTDKIRGCTLAARSMENLSILPAPISPADADLVSEDRLRSIIDAVQYAYDVIVFDMPSHLCANSLVAMDCADEVVFVTSSEPASLKNMVQATQTLSRLNLPGRFTGVLNKSTARHAREAMNSFDLDMWIPLEDPVARATADGKLLARERRTAFVDCMDQLALRLVADTGYEFVPDRSSWLSRLFQPLGERWTAWRNRPRWQDFLDDEELWEDEPQFAQADDDYTDIASLTRLRNARAS
jgi:MinD-like ATPase involved in chromosome partitioning or flagellar assembly